MHFATVMPGLVSRASLFLRRGWPTRLCRANLDAK